MKLKMIISELRNPSEVLGSNSRLPVDLVDDRRRPQHVLRGKHD
jgi:hypothetical protein